MQMPSHVLYKTRCPKCAEQGKDRSGDNLGVYSDGHSYCYSCGYSTGSDGISRLKSSISIQKVVPDLPEDVTNKLGREAHEWLLKYFDPKDFPRCLYSSSERKLFFILDNWCYQYRYFGTDPKHPKWKGYGINEELMHIVNPSPNYVASGCLTIVEDLISGYKVGHITPTLVLFGSNISLKRLARIKQLGYDSITIWLDWDKRDYAIKVAKLAQDIGLHSRVIHSNLDPKEYDYDTIKYLLERKVYETL